MPQPSWIPLTHEQKDEFSAIRDALGSDPRYFVVPQEKIPSVYSPIFREKLDSALIMSSTGPQGTVFLGVNALRVDSKARAIDEEPFGVAILSTGHMESGVFLHHGDWPGRTRTVVPNGFWDAVVASGVG